MKQTLPYLLLCISILGGCSVQVKSKYALEQIELDKQLLDSANKIAQTQIELIKTRKFSPDAVPSPNKLITIKWHGDAKELLHIIALKNKLIFKIMGAEAPLAINLEVKSKPLWLVIQQITALIYNRASLTINKKHILLNYFPEINK